MRIEEISGTRPSQVAALSALAGPVSEVERLRAFWRRVERFAAGTQVRLSSGIGAARQVVIVSGWACELRIL
jgi:hypothetical protein